MNTVKKMKAIVLFVALFGGMSVFAQVPQQMQQQQQKKIDVKDSEVQEFANVYQKVMKKNDEAQQKIVGAIEKEGMSVERYQELRNAENDPNAEVKLKDDEKKQKEDIDQKIEQMVPQLQKEQTDIIKNSKLSKDRYDEISLALRSDKDLQQRIQKVLMKNQGN